MRLLHKYSEVTYMSNFDFLLSTEAFGAFAWVAVTESLKSLQCSIAKLELIQNVLRKLLCIKERICCLKKKKLKLKLNLT